MNLNEKLKNLIPDNGYLVFGEGDYKYKIKRDDEEKRKQGKYDGSKGFLVRFLENTPTEIVIEHGVKKQIKTSNRSLRGVQTFALTDGNDTYCVGDDNLSLTEMLKEGTWQDAFIIPKDFKLVVLGEKALGKFFGEEVYKKLKDLSISTIEKDFYPKLINQFSSLLLSNDFKQGKIIYSHRRTKKG